MNTRRFTLLTLTTLLGVAALSGCTATETHGSFSRAEAPRLELTSFESCDDTLQHLRDAAAPYITERGLQPPRFPVTGNNGDGVTAQEDSAAAAPEKNSTQSPQSREYSGTNNHEQDVDEADIVKTNGEQIFTLRDQKLHVIDASTRTLAHTLDLSKEQNLTPTQLLLNDTRLIVILRRYEYHPAAPSAPTPESREPHDTTVIEKQHPTTVAVLYDVSEKPQQMGRVEIDGEYLDAREIDGRVRLVSRSGPRIAFPDHPRGTPESEAVQKNQAVVANSSLTEWVPQYTLTTSSGEQNSRSTPCQNVVTPPEASGTNLLSVHTLSFTEKFVSAEPLTLAADGSDVYATTENLYVTRRSSTFATPDKRPQEGQRITPSDLRTEIYAFDISEKGTPTHTASGWVPGTLLNQYSLSEHDGYLRIATTGFSEDVICCDTQPESVSSVYVLQHRGDTLQLRGSVSGLGKGERIYAVRFLGSMGYVVTFRQTDPLYTLDISDPENPQVTGELKITGYSAYLHPGPTGTIIGVGQEADKQGRRQGTQISVFDVSNPEHPTRIDQYHVPRSSSSVEANPHAFMYWERLNLLAIPIHSYGVGRAEPGTPDGSVSSSDVARAQSKVVFLRVTQEGLSELDTVTHPAGGHTGRITRTLVIDDTVWTISRAGALAIDAISLQQQQWVGF